MGGGGRTRSPPPPEFRHDDDDIYDDDELASPLGKRIISSGATGTLKAAKTLGRRGRATSGMLLKPVAAVPGVKKAADLVTPRDAGLRGRASNRKQGGPRVSMALEIEVREYDEEDDMQIQSPGGPASPVNCTTNFFSTANGLAVPKWF